ncbi:MAG: hypothetical protein EZS28_022043 [Streblomastix strix]|uniref:Uncharacterized protein n=1 Tax=Streblomastix strix TaxID=222440 RepID=A0A5J4VIW4_9EUKA|nr:MAG: hypothetical protein EZS28_022043 [Streblomastix strix]
MQKKIPNSDNVSVASKINTYLDPDMDNQILLRVNAAIKRENEQYKKKFQQSGYQLEKVNELQNQAREQQQRIQQLEQETKILQKQLRDKEKALLLADQDQYEEKGPRILASMQKELQVTEEKRKAAENHVMQLNERARLTEKKNEKLMQNVENLLSGIEAVQQVAQLHANKASTQQQITSTKKLKKNRKQNKRQNDGYEDEGFDNEEEDDEEEEDDDDENQNNDLNITPDIALNEILNIVQEVKSNTRIPGQNNQLPKNTLEPHLSTGLQLQLGSLNSNTHQSQSNKQQQYLVPPNRFVQVEHYETQIKQLQSRTKGNQSQLKNHQMISASVTPNSDRQNPRNLNNSQNYYQNFNSPPIFIGSNFGGRMVSSSAPVPQYPQHNQQSNQQQKNKQQQLQLPHAVMVPLHQYLPADAKDIEIERLRNQNATIMQKKDSAIKHISLQHVHLQAQTDELKKALHEKEIEIAVRQREIDRVKLQVKGGYKVPINNLNAGMLSPGPGKMDLEDDINQDELDVSDDDEEEEEEESMIRKLLTKNNNNVNINNNVKNQQDSNQKGRNSAAPSVNSEIDNDNAVISISSSSASSQQQQNFTSQTKQLISPENQQLKSNPPSRSSVQQRTSVKSAGKARQQDAQSYGDDEFDDDEDDFASGPAFKVLKVRNSELLEAKSGLEAALTLLQEPTQPTVKQVEETATNQTKVMREPVSKAKKAERPNSGKTVMITHGGVTFAIPRSLAAQEGDSESQKLYKRKKIHQLASAAKREAEESAYKERQSAWQKFNRKFEKKGGVVTKTNFTRNQGPQTIGKVQVNVSLLQSAV